MTFDEELQIINNAVYILTTGKKLTSENGTLMKSFKVINKAIKLHSIEVDMGLLMLSKIFQTTNIHLDSGRVVQLLRDDDIGKHLICLLDNYFWSYHGFIVIFDHQWREKSMLYTKEYKIQNRVIRTGFTKKDDIDSFIIREIKGYLS